MSVKIGDIAPDFRADTTEGTIRFHDWLGDSWAVLFSHPKDFTPVCTSEFGNIEPVKPEFDRRGVKIIGLSGDVLGKRDYWERQIGETQRSAPDYPIIADIDFSVSELYGMLPVDALRDPARCTPAFRQTVRNLLVIAANKKVKLILAYPVTAERIFDVVLRVIDSLELTVNDRAVMPAIAAGEKGSAT